MREFRRGFFVCFFLALGFTQPALGQPAGEERPATLVVDFVAAPGIEENLVKTLENLFGSYLVGLGDFEVIAQKDLVTLLEVDFEKQLLGCSEEVCLARIGGALGARWIVSGNVALLGGRRVLTLKLVDAEAVRLEKQLTRTLPKDEGDYAEAIRVATYDLYDLQVPVIDEPWYQDPLILGVLGAVLLAGGGAYSLLGSSESARGTTPQNPPDAHLGTVVFGIRGNLGRISW